MDKYRKYLEPQYGEVNPEVEIGTPEVMDLEHPGEWRVAQHLSTIAELVQGWRKCNCYSRLMAIKTRNTTVDSSGYELPVRIYFPPTEGECPVMIFYHGGGFMYNNPDVYDQVHRYFAAFGNFIVIAPDYRLAPENKFPAGVEDCYKTLEWVQEHQKEWKGSGIFIAGDSAGGNLAAVVAQMARDRNGPVISGQILLYPVVILNPGCILTSEKRYGKGYFLEYSSEDKTINKIYLETEKEADSPYVSPLCAETLGSLPPACFVSAECDPLLDQALMYAARLEDEGVEVEFHLYTGVLHAFINRPTRKSIEALDAIIKFVQGHSTGGN